MSDLKPCPFCDSRAEHYSFNYRKHTVRCSYCLADCGEHDTLERAAFVWNTRPAEYANDKEIENLKAALKQIAEIANRRGHLSVATWQKAAWYELAKIAKEALFNAPDTGKMEKNK